MDFATAKQTLSDRGFSYLADTQLTLMLNNAKNEFEDAYPFPWLETSTTGTAPLTIADLKHVVYVTDPATDRQLIGLDPRDIPDMDPDVTTTGVGVYWWIDGVSTLRTYPTNTSTVLTVRYVKFSPELANPTETPLIPTRYHSMWIDYAVIEAYKEANNFTAANAVLGDLMRRMNQLLEVFTIRNLQNAEYTVMSPWGSEDS